MTTRPGFAKYFIALVPPSPVYEEAQRWKEFFKTNFNTKAALNSPPHITLHMPFEWKEAKEVHLVQVLKAFAKTQDIFPVTLHHFGCFGSRVIFLAVGEAEALRHVQTALTQFCKTNLNLFNANRLDEPFHPHLTVAFRDIKKAIFPHAWQSVEAQPFHASFMCTELTLLKRSGRLWREHTKLLLRTR
jgi:2'-5' RNA ligase